MTSSPTGLELAADAERLAALDGYDILDTEPEQGFDDIVLLASQICEAPTALVSLVAKDRQWFKARIGFNPCETPLDQSVCAHALGADDLLVITDLTQDPRTWGNALVTGEPHLRFYAGAPLHTPEGATLGTLCVIDTAPRPHGLDDGQRSGLRALARQVMVQLELHRAVENRGQALAARAKAEEQMRLAAEATGIGVFDFEPRSGALHWDHRVRALFGVPERSPVSYEGSFLANIHADDRAHADAAVQSALDPSGACRFDTEYRVIAADTGTERWLAARGQAIVEGGETVRFVGTVRDISAQKGAEFALRATEERYRLAARATTDAIWDWEFASNHVLWNEALTEAYGHAPEDVEPTGDWWIDHIHPHDRAKVDASIHAVIDGTGTAWTDEYRFLRADGSYAPVLDRGYVIRDANGRAIRMIGAMLDLTSIRAAEAALRDARRKLDMERSLLQAIFRQAPVGIAVADAASAWTTMINTQAEEMLGHGLGAPGEERQAGYGALHADDTPYALTDYPTLRALRDGEAVRAEEMRYRNGITGEVRRFEVSSAPVRDEAGGIQAAVTVLVDVEDRRRAEAMQTLMNHELGHRMKNLLTMVQSIAVQTLRGATDLGAVKEILGERLVALGKAQDILLGSDLDRAAIGAVIRGGVGAHDEFGRFRYEGPDVEISRGAALSLSLMIHELTTNAAKYGALSVEDGRVEVTWSLAPGAEEADLCIAWRESGGPVVVAPTRKGFGSRLIERGLSGQVGAEIAVDYAAGGVTCHVRAPLGAFQKEG
ncbi:PAS domain-containing protein [Methylobacterium sp. 77]|uniref:PAS domain-containing protein n=1 Tax=Methylobacterium sp. 77 TaxID=1101192 RepID=UPI00037696BB|nr:PAS domain-containing protein [Methylobacterium sp. 77]